MQNAIINSLIIAKNFIIKLESGYVPRTAILELQYQMARKDFSQTVVLEFQYQQYQTNENLFLLSKKCNIINKGIERKYFNTLYFFSIFDYQKLFSQLLPPKNGKFWKFLNSQIRGVVSTQFLIHKSRGGTYIVF
ncbi:unnamed protein product (macronuclear) [Paramecium tetraurelia]|uniref:Uncharacterized protein n=1 Tax=Paramecium tetraurelia TaxID=5888 RepID=A0CTW6_PARTE|nr:uncharacterized protein GSPATT00010467001 [Paramecium tetraurelia]CAK74233.1 unnamed protein product [Paramecium tetraurelia]|eukprot:XP_001441630.1 hypothetical protein (macronuclear) [Paramecium tetraurelia strain d4-2]